MYCACDTSAVIGPVPPRANARQGALSALKGYSRLCSLHDVFAEVETWTDRESRRESAIPQEIAAAAESVKCSPFCLLPVRYQLLCDGGADHVSRMRSRNFADGSDRRPDE